MPDFDTIRRTYSTMTIGGHSGFGDHPALLVIDFQKAFTLPGGIFYGEHEDRITQTKRLLDAAREARHPVVFTVVAYDESELLNDCYVWLHKIPGLRDIRTGSAEADVDDRLRPLLNEFVIVKKAQNAFLGTPLAAILTGLGVDTLVVTGCSTDSCVRATVMDATGRGYHVVIPREAVGTHVREVNDASLFDMEAKNADVITTDAALAYLQSVRHSRSPEALGS